MTHHFGLILILSVGLSLQMAATGSEIDSFSTRYQLTEDVTANLNAITNQQLALAAERANKALYKRNKRRQSFNLPSQSCDDHLFYKQMVRLLVKAPINPLETYIHNHPQMIAQSQRDRKATIYSEFTFYETPALGILPKIGATVKIGDFVIGTDKFGHFLTEGWVYFKHIHRTAKSDEVLEDTDTDPAEQSHSVTTDPNLEPITWIIEHGDWLEKYPYGALTTGVYSHADLVANLNGLHFWQQLLATDASKLPGMPVLGPYFVCQNQQWVQIKHFDWLEYVDAAWDEGINCNRFRNADIEAKVQTKISQLEHQMGRSLSCPLAHPDPVVLQQKYKMFYPWIVNLKGNKTLKHDTNTPTQHATTKHCAASYNKHKSGFRACTKSS